MRKKSAAGQKKHERSTGHVFGNCKKMRKCAKMRSLRHPGILIRRISTQRIVAHLFGHTLRGDTRLVNALSHEARVPAMAHAGSQAQAHEATPPGVFPRREIPRARKRYRLHTHAPARAPILAAKPRRAFAKRD